MIGNPWIAMRNAMEVIEPELERSDRSGVYGVWVRRTGMLLMAAVTVVALCNVFGQRASDASGSSAAATVIVHSPSRVRAGLLFQGRITVEAHQALPAATLVLSRGWVDGLTMNTAEPSPSTQTSGPGGSLILGIGALHAGETFVQYFEYQVNPTSVSSRVQQVTLRSSGADVVSVRRTMTILP
jgi:hypothetical protein